LYRDSHIEWEVTCTGAIPTFPNAAGAGLHRIVARGDSSLIEARTTFTLT
jgi:hypothetical protein